MTIEVFHWRVTRDGQLHRDVCDLYTEIARGKREAITLALSDAAAWDQRGLILQKVAEVATDDKNTAFDLTNHVDACWTQNDGVVAMGNGRWRSTSVGDVMRVAANDGAGGRHDVLYVVAPMGFEEISVPALPHRAAAPETIAAPDSRSQMRARF